MASGNFDRAMAHVFRSEGGYVDHPHDPGGATNMGITIGTLSQHLGRRATKAEVRALDRATAARIYRRKYWNAVRADDLPPGVDLVAFDGAVNSGPSRGAKWLQAALGVAQDGKIGPQTIAAAKMRAPADTIREAIAARRAFLRRLKTWSTFGKGWERRLASVEAEALDMIGHAPAPVRPDVEPATPTTRAPSWLARIIAAILRPHRRT